MLKYDVMSDRMRLVSISSRAVSCDPSTDTWTSSVIWQVKKMSCAYCFDVFAQTLHIPGSTVPIQTSLPSHKPGRERWISTRDIPSNWYNVGLGGSCRMRSVQTRTRDWSRSILAKEIIQERLTRTRRRIAGAASECGRTLMCLRRATGTCFGWRTLATSVSIVLIGGVDNRGYWTRRTWTIMRSRRNTIFTGWEEARWSIDIIRELLVNILTRCWTTIRMFCWGWLIMETVIRREDQDS